MYIWCWHNTLCSLWMTLQCLVSAPFMTVRGQKHYTGQIIGTPAEWPDLLRITTLRRTAPSLWAQHAMRNRSCFSTAADDSMSCNAQFEKIATGKRTKILACRNLQNASFSC